MRPARFWSRRKGYAMPNAIRLAAELRHDIHVGTDASFGEDIYIPLDELKKRSVHVVGAAGYGKSRFLMGLIRQFVRYNQPFALIDPHRDLYDFAVSAVRRSAASAQKVVLVDPGDDEYAVAFNPLACGIEDPSEASSLVLEAVLKVWGSRSFDDTPRLEGILRATFRLLVDNDLTLLEAPEILNVDNGALRRLLCERVYIYAAAALRPAFLQKAGVDAAAARLRDHQLGCRTPLHQLRGHPAPRARFRPGHPPATPKPLSPSVS
jgi:hypothetical protein